MTAEQILRAAIIRHVGGFSYPNPGKREISQDKYLKTDYFAVMI